MAVEVMQQPTLGALARAAEGCSTAATRVIWDSVEINTQRDQHDAGTRTPQHHLPCQGITSAVSQVHISLIASVSSYYASMLILSAIHPLVAAVHLQAVRCFNTSSSFAASTRSSR
jgi:hypothetical protein